MTTLWQPRPQFRPWSDPFFEAGNRLRHSAWQQRHGAISQTTLTDPADLSTASHSAPTISCSVRGCSYTCSRPSELDAHYFSTHHNVCNTCGRSFATSKLLNIHVLEIHDAFFPFAAKTRPMFECLAPDCSTMLWSRRKRRDHMIEVHKYPPDFQFARIVGKLPQKSQTQATTSQLQGSSSPVKPPTDGQSVPALSATADVGSMDTAADEAQSDTIQQQHAPKVPSSFSFGRRRGRGLGGFGRGRGARGRAGRQESVARNGGASDQASPSRQARQQLEGSDGSESMEVGPDRRRGRQGKKCYLCGQRGHIQRKCPQRQDELRELAPAAPAGDDVTMHD